MFTVNLCIIFKSTKNTLLLFPFMKGYIYRVASRTNRALNLQYGSCNGFFFNIDSDFSFSLFQKLFFCRIVLQFVYYCYINCSISHSSHGDHIENNHFGFTPIFLRVVIIITLKVFITKMEQKSYFKLLCFLVFDICPIL